MFLRSENRTELVENRIKAVDRRIASLRQTLSLSEVPDPRTSLDLAQILMWRGNYRASMQLIEPFTQPCHSQEIILEAWQMVGDNHFRHDQYDLASKQYRENLERAVAVGSERWTARAEDGFAWVLIDVGHYTTGEFEEAGKIFARQLPKFKRLGDRLGEGMTLYGLSRAEAGGGHYGRAIDLALESIELFQANEGEFLLQLPLLQLGDVHRDRGDFDEARHYFERAVTAADRSQDPYVQVLTALGFGTMLFYTGEIDEAVELWRAALPTAEELEFPRVGHELCSRLAKVLFNRGEYKEAYGYQLACREFGNRVGVISSILHNQQMLLREQMTQTAQLESALNYLWAGVGASVDGIFVLMKPNTGMDQDEFLVQFVNESGAAMLGFKPVNINHVLIRSVLTPEAADKLIPPSLEVFESGRPLTLEALELKHADGLPRWFSVKIGKTEDGVVWTVSDVTARHEMQREILAHRDSLERANARLTALDREKSEMLGIAAHDLRSPIGNIRSLSELIVTEDPENVELLKTIGNIADSLLGLIQNLLDVERIERGELELKMDVVSVRSVAEQIRDQFAADAAQKQIAVRLEMSDEPLTAWADHSAVARVLQNLVSNALKFSPFGSIVTVRIEEGNNVLRAEVIDRGEGLSVADQSRLFSKFARLSARPTAGESSTGLGLSIVRRLVEAMDGQVGCVSEQGAGAMFWFELPRSNAATRLEPKIPSFAA